MEYCDFDAVLPTTSTLMAQNEADSGYEPSPTGIMGPSMFNFEDESEPDDGPSFDLHSPSSSDNEDDTILSVTGRPSSSPIPIPLSGHQFLLSHSSPGLGYSLGRSPFRRLSCPPQILQPTIFRVMRHVGTQTRLDQELVEEPRLAPIREPLPDVVQLDGRRPGHVERARSASVSLPVDGIDISPRLTEIGQTLRRMSDEFERSRRSSRALLFPTRTRQVRSYSQSDT